MIIGNGKHPKRSAREKKNWHFSPTMQMDSDTDPAADAFATLPPHSRSTHAPERDPSNEHDDDDEQAGSDGEQVGC
jgi:hypothetical protein